jgi:peptide deformylase
VVTTLDIRLFGDPVLRQRARPVDRVTEVHRRLGRDMLETMRAAPGVGLAGPQVGVLDRIFVWEVDERYGVLLNPVIEERSDELVEGEEGCLSIPGLYFPVLRAAEVRVAGIGVDGEPVALDADGLLARVCQHEIDHLDGVLFIDRLPDALRREALARLREQILGLAPASMQNHPEETL